MAFPEDPELTEHAEHAEPAEPAEPAAPSESAALSKMRESYRHAELHEDEVAADPLEQFRRWMDDAIRAEVPEPNAMVLTTIGPDRIPSARTVLLKGLDDRGFAFYTNLGSDKARDLAANPVAALVFPWHAMERQVRVSGAVTEVMREEAENYFASRPRDSQLGAWASRQSEVVPDRATLDRAYAELEERYPEGTKIPMPAFWGGYRVAPTMYEFWQGRVGRLHDRIRYRLVNEQWIVERLAP